MNAIHARRKYVFQLQRENLRMPDVEAENAVLKSTINKLQEEAKEYLRLMDSFKNAPGTFRALDLPEDSSPLNLALELGDDEELEELRKRIAELERALSEEAQARQRVERELTEERTRLEEEKAKNRELVEKVSALQRLCALRTIRPDKVVLTIQNFVVKVG